MCVAGYPSYLGVKIGAVNFGTAEASWTLFEKENKIKYEKVAAQLHDNILLN